MKTIEPLRIDRATAFAGSLVAAFLLPAAIPRFGIDFTYFFIVGIVFLAWFSIKWPAVRSLKLRSSMLERVLGLSAVAAVYAYKIITVGTLGVLIMTILFSALAVTFYGIRSMKLFWVPAAYGLVLLFGYWIEGATPNYVALQDWMASIMASSMQAIGVNTIVSGHLVYLNSRGLQLGLDVQSDCTGVQGILAFGLLSTMSLLDVKPRWSRLVPIFAIGFLGAFLINIVRLFVVFLTFEYGGIAWGTTVHVYLGYLLFIGWVLLFWSVAFRYMVPRSHLGISPASMSMASPSQG